MQAQAQQEPDVEFIDEAYVTQPELAAPGTWTLFDREQVRAKFQDGRVEVLFYERWIDQASNSGIVAYGMIGNGQDRCPLGHTHQAGELYFILEQFADPVNPESFKQSSDSVKQSEFSLEGDLRAGMRRLMERQSLTAAQTVVNETPLTADARSATAHTREANS